MSTTPITAQMIFDAAWQKFIIEEAPPAVREQASSKHHHKYLCSYLTEDGRKCAVGLCIPDGHPLQQSNVTLPYLCAGEYHKMFNLTGEQQNTLQDALHDDLINKNTGEWNLPLKKRKDAYVEVAQRFNLTLPLT